MNSSGTAFFIEPQGSLREALTGRKAWLEQTKPGQALCGHPPHCTVLFGNYGPPDRWLESLRRRISALAPFELATDGWQQFPRDTLAAGGHTVAYRVRPTPALALLQQITADCLAPFVTASPNAHPLAAMEPFADSLRKFGFPFVGKHWIPHFTIGSPQVGPDDPLLARLMSGQVQHRFVVRTLSVWRVAGHSHERLHELALAGTQI